MFYFFKVVLQFVLYMYRLILVIKFFKKMFQDEYKCVKVDILGQDVQDYRDDIVGLNVIIYFFRVF